MLGDIQLQYCFGGIPGLTEFDYSLSGIQSKLCTSGSFRRGVEANIGAKTVLLKVGTLPGSFLLVTSCMSKAQ